MDNKDSPDPLKNPDDKKEESLRYDRSENANGLIERVLQCSFQSHYGSDTARNELRENRAMAIEENDAVKPFAAICKARNDAVYARLQHKRLQAQHVLMKLEKDKTERDKDHEASIRCNAPAPLLAVKALLPDRSTQGEWTKSIVHPKKINHSLIREEHTTTMQEIQAGDLKTKMSNPAALMEIKPSQQSPDPPRKVITRPTLPSTKELTLRTFEEAKEIMDRMHTKLAFPRNPRFAMTSTPVLIASPNPLVFSKYEAGCKIVQAVRIQNKSQVSRRIRVLPPKTTYFSIVRIEYPEADNACLAPGLSARVLIQFAPDSGGRYSDILMVPCEGTQSDTNVGWNVRLEASRLPPVLSLPPTLTVKPALLGGQSDTLVECKNMGGDAIFWIFSWNVWKTLVPEWKFDAADMHSCATFCGDYDNHELWRPRIAKIISEMGPNSDISAHTEVFVISPRHFQLTKGQKVDLNFQFIPLSAEIHRESFVIVSDTCEAIAFQVEGRSCALIMSLQFPKLPPSRLSDPPLDNVDELVFPPTFVNFDHDATPSRQQIILRNNSLVDIKYAWKTLPTSFETIEVAFQISPVVGEIKALESASSTISFAPQELGNNLANFELEVAQVDAIIEVDDLRLKKYFKLQLHGVGKLGKFLMEPSAVLAPCLVCNEPYEWHIRLRNETSAPVNFDWDPHGIRLLHFQKFDITLLHIHRQNSEQFVIDIEPQRGTLLAHDSVAVCFRMVPLYYGSFSIAVPCGIPLRYEKNSTAPDKQWLLMQGDVEHAQIRFLEASIDFGLLRTGEMKEITTILQNDSQYASAEWRLSHWEASVSTLNNLSLPKCVFPEPCLLRDSEDPPSLLTPRDLPQLASLTFSPNQGVVGPGQSVSVCIQCRAGSSPEVFRGSILCQLKSERQFCGKESCYYTSVRTEADIQCPIVYALPRVLDLGIGYIGMENQAALQIINVSSLTTDFRWIDVQGPCAMYNLFISPRSGTLISKETVNIKITCVPLQPGHVVLLLACIVQGLPNPLGVEITLEQQDLALSFQVVKDTNSKHEVEHCAIPELSFNNALVLNEKRTIFLSIRNQSGLEAVLHIAPEKYSSAEPPDISYTHTISNFFSTNGRGYTRKARDARQRQSLLSLGNGIAFSISPSNLQISPWKSVIVSITCFNNMPGMYHDKIIVSPSTATTTIEIPIRVKVEGDPLTWNYNRSGILLRKKKFEEAVLAFGDFVVSAQSVSRTLYIINRTPRSAHLCYRIVPYNGDDRAMRVVLGIDAFGKCHAKIMHATERESSLPSPFAIDTPASRSKKPLDSEVQILGFGQAKVKVTCSPKSDLGALKALLVVDAVWQDDIGSTETASPKATSVSCLHVLLTAEVLEPYLSVRLDKNEDEDYEEERLSAKALIFTSIWPSISCNQISTQSQQQKELHLINHFTVPLTFRLECTRPFAITKASSLAPKHPLRSPNHLHFSKSRSDMIFKLPPRMSVHAHLALAIEDETAEQHLNALSAESHKLVLCGELCIKFSQGFTQIIPLKAELIRPCLRITPTYHDFGSVSLTKRGHVVVHLANTSPASARYTIEYVPQLTMRGSILSLRAEPVGLHKDDPQVFHFDMRSGSVHGPTMSLSSIGGWLPAQSQASTLKAIVHLTISFQPSECVHYRSQFRFRVACGSPIDLILEGGGVTTEFEPASLLLRS